MNKVILIGTVVDRFESKQTKNGKTFLTGRLKTEETRNDMTFSQHHSVTIWGAAAQENEGKLNDGDMVFIEGKISYSSRGEGAEKKYYTNIDALNVEHISSSSQSNSSPF